MNYIKLLHILFMIIWVGQLLSLSRLLGYNRKLSVEALKEMVPLYYRMYLFVEVPSMILAIGTGVLLMLNKMEVLKMPYFHLKLTLVGLLVILDFVLGKSILDLKHNVVKEGVVKYKILHGLCGLVLIGVLYAIYVMKLIGK